MSKHTDGKMRWSKRNDGSLIYIIGDHKVGAHAQGDIYINEADLRRIVACWNACEGLSTEALEQVEPGEIVGWGRIAGQLPSLLAQRSELLDALHNMLEDGDSTDRQQALAAIEKATGLRKSFPQVAETGQ